MEVLLSLILRNLFLSSISQVRLVRILRVSRVVRIFRMARIVRFVQALRTLMLALLHTFKSAFWALLLVMLIIYSFGIAFTLGVTDFTANLSEGVSPPHLSELRTFWGTLPKSVFTLFKSIA